MSSAFKSNHFVLPVTALEIVIINNLQYICAGIGSRLLVLSEGEDGSSQCDVLAHHCIHGIRAVCNDLSHWLAVFGQKAVTIVTLNHIELSINHIAEVAVLSDWILDIHWLRNSDQSISHELAVVTAHNTVLSWKWSKNECSEVACSEVNCILCHGNTWDNLCVAVGTVFNDILIWMVCGHRVDNRVLVAMTLKGHEGVIFSVRFSNHGDKLCSVSDDRSVRLWKLPSDYGNQRGVTVTEALMVLYGHTARIWDAMIIPTGVVSVGEDATCRLWSRTGECVQVIEGHKGRGIWSMCINKDSSKMITGGADGGIRASSLAALQVGGAGNGGSNAESWEVWLPENRKPQSVVLTDDVTAIVLSTTGYLYQVKLDKCSSSSCELLEADPTFAAYSVMSLSPGGGHLVMGNLSGIMKLLTLPYHRDCYERHAHDGKVFSLHWTITSLLISCGPEGRMCCWQLCDDKLVKMADMLLPWSKHRWLSAIATGPSCHLVCGDKKGSIHLYKLPLRDDVREGVLIEPISSLKGIHGSNGVTYLCYNNGHFYSTGRDGYCRQYKINQSDILKEINQSETLVELAKYKVFRGLEWIEKLLFVDHHQLAVGFHSTDFVIFDITDNKMLYQCHCGGGHRSWDLYLLQHQVLNRSSVFGYVKDSRLHFKQLRLNHSSCIVMEGIHGREITCVTNLGLNNGVTYFATASEDTSINVMEFDGNTLKCIYTADGHISTVRALSCCHRNEQSLLFSGGGRASFKVWRITIATEGTATPVLSLLDETFLTNMTEKQKRKHQRKTPLVPTPPECRVMSLTSFSLLYDQSSAVPSLLSVVYCIIVGCSDSFIRIYTYSDDRGIVLVDHLDHQRRCVLCVKHFSHPKVTHANTPVKPDHPEATCADNPVKLNDHVIICSAATDGQLVLWDVTIVIQTWLDSVLGYSLRDDVCPLVPRCVIQCHQSGINDLDIKYVTGGEYHITSCGDDGSVAMTTLHLDVSSSSQLFISHHEVYKELSAHSSCCTGVKWLQCDDVDHFVSVSTDQRLNVWSIVSNRITLRASHVIHVADVAAMETIRVNDDSVIILCGVGLQCIMWTTS